MSYPGYLSLSSSLFLFLPLQKLTNGKKLVTKEIPNGPG